MPITNTIGRLPALTAQMNGHVHDLLADRRLGDEQPRGRPPEVQLLGDGELGVRLFDWTKRSVRLSDAGAAFLTPCRQALAGVDNAGRLARNAGTGEYGTIRLGFNAGFATDHLVILARMIGREHPHLELVFDSSRATPDILAMLRDDRLDIGLVGGPAAGVGLRRRRIGATSLGVLLPESHALAPANPVPVRHLADEHLVLVDAAPGWSIRALVQAAFDRSGITPAGIATVADGMTMLSFVAAGIGVGFASMNTLVGGPARHDPAAAGRRSGDADQRGLEAGE